jgi:hypothetical protein
LRLYARPVSDYRLLNCGETRMLHALHLITSGHGADN